MIILTKSKRLRNKGWHKSFKIWPRLLDNGNEYVVGWVMQKYYMDNNGIGYKDNMVLCVKYMKMDDWSWALSGTKQEKCND